VSPMRIRNTDADTEHGDGTQRLIRWRSDGYGPRGRGLVARTRWRLLGFQPEPGGARSDRGARSVRRVLWLMRSTDTVLGGGGWSLYSGDYADLDRRLHAPGVFTERGLRGGCWRLGGRSAWSRRAAAPGSVPGRFAREPSPGHATPRRYDTRSDNPLEGSGPAALPGGTTLVRRIATHPVDPMFRPI
jgi:hypothetical protein